MGLSLALDSARSALLATSSQIATTARNTAGANDPGYSRKIVSLVTGTGGTTVVVTRASDSALFTRKLSAASAASESQALLDGLTRLSQTVGDTSDAGSPAARLGALNAALQAAANRPDDAGLARTAVESARDLATSLNSAADAVQNARAEADRGMTDSVARINDLLGQFDIANRAVMRGTASGQDVSDSLDTRDRIVSQLSAEIGISVSDRPGGDMAIYTDSGVTLFDRGARTVSLTPTAAFSAGTVGSAVTIDGVPVTGAASPMRLSSGRLAGLATLRDESAVTYGNQLDAIAGALIDTFKETGAAGPKAGLFTAGAAGRCPAGLECRARREHRAQRRRRPDPRRRRHDPARRRHERRRLQGQSGHGRGLRDAPARPGRRARHGAQLRPGPPLNETATLAGFAADSAGWLEATRKAASGEADYQKTLLGRASDALSNAVGVNGDDETAQMLQLQRSYTASAKILTMVDDLLQTLLTAIR